MPFETLSPWISEQIAYDRSIGKKYGYGYDNRMALRKYVNSCDLAWRSPFATDIDSILACPFFNRYADKTQVFSLFRNDDITRRSLHIQLVSRIARTIGNTLGLNSDLIEAISLGNDLGHTPFARAGERYLDEVYFADTGRHYRHNVQSIRVLDKIFPFNMTLQTLNGIAAHCGDLSLDFFRPVEMTDFDTLYNAMDKSEYASGTSAVIPPSTLEACVVRIADIIAYLGQDRDDAVRATLLDGDSFEGVRLGRRNDEIINNLIVNIIENSYGKPYITMDEQHFAALLASKDENHALIYEDSASRAHLEDTVRPMMAQIYEHIVDDIVKKNYSSPVYTHHIEYVSRMFPERNEAYPDSDPSRTAADFIAGMTDDYFIDLHKFFFPESRLRVEYIGYFDPRFERKHLH